MSQGLARTRRPVGAPCSSTALSQILTHTQQSSLPKGQVGVPNRHAEVDAAVGRLHASEAEGVPGRISKHGELLLLHLLAVHSPFGEIPEGQELVVTVSARGLALPQPVDARVSG